MKKWLIKISIIIGALALVFFASFIPTLWLKTGGMTLLNGEYVNVYYETEKDAAVDVFHLANEKADEISHKLGFTEKQDVNIYIYDSQYTMQTKKYGLIVPIFGLDWYIGDNIGTNVILTSPANPGAMHDYDNNKYAAVHEMVHAYISIFNPKIKLWLTEGVALYLANGEAFSRELLERYTIPTYEDIKTENPIRFSNMGGYTFAHTYIEYLDKTYGWDKVLDLLNSENYDEVFGKTEQDIYDEWVQYITNYPQ
jgi:hypothetical protein